MKNSIRFLSRALTGAFVMLTLLGHSLLGQLTSMSITYPESSVSLVEGQEFSIIASLSWDPAGPAEGDITVTRIYEGIPTDLDIFQEVKKAEPSVSISGLVIPELTGLSNQVTYVLNYSERVPLPSSSSTQITFTIGTASPVDGELTDVSIDFPMENAQVSVTEPIWIQASVLPLNYSNNAKVDFYAEGYKINGGAIASTNGLFNFTWSDHWVGTIRITARATLNNGTFRESEVRRIRVLP
ncbi:MAG: hypothetical protein PHF70_05655, partial [Opitutales bacterium]|nr:hypothetical protein [Opitutales bacterium]